MMTPELLEVQDEYLQLHIVLDYELLGPGEARARRACPWNVTLVRGSRNYVHMKTTASEGLALFRGAARPRHADPGAGRPSALEEFEQVYRANVAPISAYFARRCSDPQTVADLTSETFVRGAAGFARFDARRGSPRAWLFGIAARVFATHCAAHADGVKMVLRLAGDRPLPSEEIEDLAARIDAQREGRELLERCARLSAGERSAIELVDIAGLTPKEAADAVGVSAVVLRKRLSRARHRLRKERRNDDSIR